MNRGSAGSIGSAASASEYRVCSNCRKVLRQEKRIRVSQPLTRGPSAFIPEKEVMQANGLNERTNLLVEEYSTSGRLDNITQVMSLHTQYLESFLRSQFYMLRMDGPLPLPYRHYIAIMAAARHQCSYLVNMHVDEFLKTGGIAEWLNGLEYIPQRLKNLNEINKLLAHRPWLITKEHIQKLVKTGENNWSLPELVHAVVLLAHYHALASFVFGSGINPERDPDTSNGFRLIAVNKFCVCDLANDNNIENASLTSSNFGLTQLKMEATLPCMQQQLSEAALTLPLSSNHGAANTPSESLLWLQWRPNRTSSLQSVQQTWRRQKPHLSLIADSLSELEALMERMKRLQEEKEEEEASQEEMATRFEKEKKESLLVVTGAFDDEMVSTSDVSRYIEDPGFGYKDFARRGEEHLPTFRAQDYTWENHGFSLVNRLYSDIGHLLDEKFRMVYNLTYNTMATHEDVDTTMLRRALFNYVHCMFGIRYDDYDYGEVNQLLERSLKVYIKTVTCYPERTTKRMYDSYWRQFKHSEKVHVNLLLMEARMQAELLYALRAITRHLT
ncbi:sestrin-3 isoform X3 [Malaclemys terrapin pileata]|uniref:sestrin-3 isoform X3 n=1 Tax=Malaclemys terrapin pileata TaxID=2991368 RepID=UPI0023A83928|nr:sestrin-3 isoform X3 [Malaclemys terrapin pileata]